MKEDLIAAINAYNNKEYAEAIDALLEILESDKQNWWAWFYLAMSYCETGKPENGYRIMQVIAALCHDKVLNPLARETAGELEYEFLGGTASEQANQLKMSA